jgi:hypothetical protein
MNLEHGETKMKIYLDIETIPGQREGVKEAIADTITHPGSMKKPETIAKWEDEQKPQAVEDAWRKTAFKGDQGEIICISWAVEDKAPQVVMRDLGGSERNMLAMFFAQIMEIMQPGRPQAIEWVGHNVKDFDLRFIAPLSSAFDRLSVCLTMPGPAVSLSMTP